MVCTSKMILTKNKLLEDYRNFRFGFSGAWKNRALLNQYKGLGERFSSTF